MTTWTMQDLSPSTPEEEEAWQKMAEEQQQWLQGSKAEAIKKLDPTHPVINAPEADNQPKSFWNHRVVRMPDDGLGNQWLEVQEVYYNRKGEPCGYCNSYVGGETMEELQVQIERHSKALALPILDSGTDFNNKWEDEYEKEY